MKKTKSILSILLAIIFVSLSVTPSFAATGKPPETPYEYLLSCGYSEKFLSSVTEETISRIYNAIGDNDVISVEETVYQMDENGLINRVNELGTIKETSLTIIVDASKIGPKGTNKINLCVYTVSWYWTDSKPTARFNDAITIEWGKDIFSQDCFAAQTSGILRSGSTTERTAIKEYSTPTQSLQGGLCLSFPVGSMIKYKEIGGDLVLLLAPTQPMIKGSNCHTEIDFNYVHNTVPVSVGASISYKGLGISVTMPPQSDSLSASKPFVFSRP